MKRAIFLVLTLFPGLAVLNLPGQTPPGISAGIRRSHSPAGEPPFACFEYLGKDRGIPPSVRCIRQDRQGFLWFTTKTKGLHRFDGTALKSYSNDPVAPASLPDNRINDLLIDRSGQFWLATESGVVRFDPLRERFYPVRPAMGNACFTLLEDERGRIWAGMASTGLRYYDPAGDSLALYRGRGVRDGYTGTFHPNWSFDRFYTLAQGGDGRLWANAGMYFERDNDSDFSAVVSIHPDPAHPEVIYYRPDTVFHRSPRIANDANLQYCSYIDHANRRLWMGTFFGLLEFSLDSHTWRRFRLDSPDKISGLDNSIHAILPKNDSTLWLAMETGLQLFSISHLTSNSFQPKPELGNYRPMPFRSVFRDQSGHFWFGIEEGLCHLDPFRQQFPFSSVLPAGFHAQAITEHAPNSEMLFASWENDGFFRVFARHIQTGKIRRSAQRIPYRPNDFHTVHQLFVAANGRIWVLLNKGIAWLDPHTLRLRFPDEAVENTKHRTKDLWPRQITDDTSGKLWMATFGQSIVRYDPATGRFWSPPCLPPLEGQQPGCYPLFNESLCSIHADKNGRLLLGEMGTGLEIWDQRQQRRLYGPRVSDSTSIGGTFVVCIYADRSGNTWVGTEGGLCRHRPAGAQEGTFERIRGYNGEVWRMAEDVRGRLWLSTRDGLLCYDRTFGFRTFGEKEGMRLPLYSSTPLFKSSDGHIWLGNDLHFSPAHIELTPQVAKPYISGIKIYNQPAPLPPPDTNSLPGVLTGIVFQPDQEVFTIEVGTLGFTAPEQTRLLYRLAGNEPWTDAGSQRAFTFNRLPGGRYQFQVKAIGPSGVEAGIIAALPFRIIPPFYRSFWFWLLCALLFAGGLYWIFWYRERQRREKEQLRLRIARDLHDDVGSTLSSINILTDAAFLTMELELEKQRLGNIGEKARAALDSMSDIVWAVNPENDSMPRVLARMGAFAVDSLEKAGMEVHFQIGPGVKALNLAMEQRKDFYLIFKEAVTNCAKYSRATQVQLSIAQVEGTLVLIIRDNGIGFEAGKVRTDHLGGNGLKNMHSRAETLRGILQIDSVPGSGTTVQLSIPLVP